MDKGKKRIFSLLMAFLMVFTGLPLEALAVGDREQGPQFKIVDYDHVSDDKEKYLNNGEVIPANLGYDPNDIDEANEQIADPKKDNILTLLVEYYANIGGFKVPKYQPYRASIMENGTMPVNDTINLPEIDGYSRPTPRYTLDRDTIKDHESLYKGYEYNSKEVDVPVKHSFQKLGEPNTFETRETRRQRAKVGQTFSFYPLRRDEREGFTPIYESVQVQVPENVEGFFVEIKYLRDSYDVKYNTDGGTDIRAKKLYYGQSITQVEAPTKRGATFKGWKASVDLEKMDGTGIVEKGSLIANDQMENLKMPKSEITFTAQWEEVEEAGYYILFWTEKSDHPEGAQGRDKYDYVGLNKVPNGKVGTSPDLSKVTPDGIKFPDIDLSVTSDPSQLEKFYQKNEDLTAKANKTQDSEGNLVDKKISSTGDTAFNVYYDRKVYELVFEKHDLASASTTFDPIIEKNGIKYDARSNPYTVEARFNQSLEGLWPKDNEIINWPNNKSGQGWTIAGLSSYLDSPPYRLTDNEFISNIDKNRTSVSRNVPLKENQISLGVRCGDNIHPVHVDFAKQAFIENENPITYHIDYSMYYWKSDTASYNYSFPAPELKGFSRVNPTKKQEKITKNNINTTSTVKDRNESAPEAAEKIEYQDKMGTKKFTDNGYVLFKYNRNKYDLYLNNDPFSEKEVGDYGPGDKMEVFYDKALKDLNLDESHVPEKPKSVPDEYVFKGWTLDAAGQNLVKDGNETMPNYNLTLYAKWGEPEVEHGVRIDLNGGNISGNREDINLKVKHGDVLKLPENPTRQGHIFNGWELVLYKENPDGTKAEDKSYFEKYGVPIVYATGNPVVEDLHLRAIWIDLKTSEATAYHHFYNEDGSEMVDELKEEVFNNVNVDSYLTATGKYSGNEWILRTDGEFTTANNGYFSTILVDEDKSKNIFNFNYRPFRQREYTVHYIDQDDNKIIPSEEIKNGNRDYDSRHYRDIPGYKLTSAPNVELKFNLDDKGNMTGITSYVQEGEKTISDVNSISFQYEDIRIIKRNFSKSATPDGYHRIVFKAGDGGNFGKDDNDEPIKELVYDVIDGLNFNKLPVPKDAGLIAEDGYTFDRWDNEALLNELTPIKNSHTFTANFVPTSSGKTKIVPKGARVTAQDLIDNYQSLVDQGARFSFDPVDTSTTGDKEVQVTIHHASGKTTTATAKIKVVPIVEEVTDPTAEKPDYYHRVIFDSTADGKIESELGAKKTYNIYKGTDWKEAKYQGLNIPKPQYKDDSFAFNSWDNSLDEGVLANGELPGEDFLVDTDITFTAKYGEVPTIIEYDPSNPDDPNLARPSSDYVRLSFEADEGLTLENEKAYYIKKNSGIKLGNSEIIKPNPTADLGYKFINWDKDDEFEIKEDTVVKARSQPYDDVIPAEGSITERPEGYKAVKFVAGENGIFEEKIYYVNPSKYVTLIPPAESEITPGTGYEFGGWDRDATIPSQYEEDTTITASFNQINAVSTTPVKGYVEVDFVIDGDGGSINSGETFKYYVDPNREVSLTAPKTKAETGYYFDDWDADFTKVIFKDNTTIKGTFATYDDIIPAKGADGSVNAQPDGYVKVEFNAGKNGRFDTDSNKVFYVNPNSNKTIGDVINKFEGSITSNIGYKDNRWDRPDDLKIDGSNSYIEIKRLYTSYNDIIPATDEHGRENKKPDRYTEVVFLTRKNGKIKGTERDSRKEFYVNPDKRIKFKNREDLPGVEANTGYEFAGWDPIVNYYVEYRDDITYIYASYNTLGDVLIEPKPGYVRVSFNKGNGGEFEEGAITEYWVKPGVEVSVPEPNIVEDIGKTFDGWDKERTIKATEGQEDIIIRAEYKDRPNIIPGDQEQPLGYVEVEFVADENGSLSGTTKYYVKANTQVDLTETAKGIGKHPNTGYKERGSWEGGLTRTFEEDAPPTQIKYIFDKYDNVISDTTGLVKKPAGYATVKFIAGENGSLLGGDKTYYVNPNAGVVLGSTDLPMPVRTPATDYEFSRWEEAIDESKSVTGDQTHVAIFSKKNVDLTYTYEHTDTEISGELPLQESVPIGTKVKLADSGSLKKADSAFIGWKIGDKVYKPGEEITLNTDTTAIAQWDKNTAEISYKFESEDGSDLPKAVRDQLPEKFSAKIGERVSPKDSTEFTPVKIETGENRGTWTFKEWTPTEITLTADGDKTFTGIWIFTRDNLVSKVSDITSPVPDYAVRITFDATTEGNLGTEGQKAAYDIYKGLTWREAKFQGLEIPTPSYKDDSQSFAGWYNSLDDSVLENGRLPGEEFKLENNIDFTATYSEVKKIIPYDSEEAITRPEGYVRVKFQAENGLNLMDVNYYYVKANAGVKLSELTKPNVEANLGYSPDGWDKEDDLTISADTIVKAKAKTVPDFVEAKEGIERPRGYKTVKFVPGDNGQFAEKTYYVNPNKYVTLVPPAESEMTPGVGYEFGAWSQDAAIPSQYTDEETTITANFNQLDAVFDEARPGYKKVEFIIEGPGGNIIDEEKRVYYVDPTRPVSLDAPKTKADLGFSFDKWDKNFENETFTEETTIKGEFKAFDDIIPAKGADGSVNAQPEGYVKVTLDPGQHGTFEDGMNRVFYVNPSKNKTLGQVIGSFKPRANTGYDHDSWDPSPMSLIDGSNMDIRVTATYTEKDDAIRAEYDSEGNPTNKPEGYIEVNFLPGENGQLKDDKEKITIFVNPDKAISLRSLADGIEISPNTGYSFAGWGPLVDQRVQYSDGDTIKSNYNILGDIYTETEAKENPEKVKGYIKVTFYQGEGGSFANEEEDKVFYVKPNSQVDLKAPAIKAKKGKEFEGWDKELKLNLPTASEDLTISAFYSDIGGIIPAEGKRPEGYVTIEFLTDGNGSVKGNTKYYANPDLNIEDLKLQEKAQGLILSPNMGYKEGTWTYPTEINGDTKVFHNFSEEDKVIPAISDMTEKPEGYVTVKFIAGDNGNLAGGDKTYYVNPKAKIFPGSRDLPIPETSPDENYGFYGWLEKIDPSQPITQDKTYVAAFKLNQVSLTYKADDKTEGTVPEKIVRDNGTSVDLANARDLKKDNHDFIGWKIGPSEGELEDKIYKPGDRIRLDKDMVAIAQWDLNTSKLSYIFQAAEGSPDLPKEVLDQLPQDQDIKIGQEVTAETYFEEVKVDSGDRQGTWSFDGWDKEKLTLDPDPENNVFTGTWTFTDKEKVNVNYSFSYIGGEASQGVKDEIEKLLPERKQVFKESSVDVPENITETFSDRLGDRQGKWTFRGWKPAEGQEDLQSDVNFMGIWEFIEDSKSNVSYIFDYEGQRPSAEAEAEIEKLLPQEFSAYPGTKISVPESPSQVFEDNIGGVKGKWEFKNWTPNTSQSMADENIQFTGTWTFKEKAKLDVNYEFKYIHDGEEVERPVVIKADEPENTQVYIGDEIALAEFPETYRDEINSVPGTWTFTGWIQDLTQPAGSNKYIGTWNFVPDDQVSIKYDFIFKNEAGKKVERPSDFSLNPPETRLIYKGQKASKPLESYGDQKIEKGSWTFQGWNPAEDIENVQEDQTFMGTWTFKEFDKEKYQPISDYIVKEFGQGVSKEEVLGSIGIPDYPDDKEKPRLSFDENLLPDGKTPGNFKVPVRVTYLDGTEDQLDINIQVKAEEVVKPDPKPDPAPSPEPKDDTDKPNDDERISGDDRIKTSVEVSKKFYDKADFVIIATRENYPDALTASMLGRNLKAPILLTETNTLPIEVAREIERLGAKDIIIVGGDRAVGFGVERALSAYDKDGVERLAGRDRYETSSKVARRLAGLQGGAKNAVIASGLDFADALAAAPLAGKYDAPILLVRTNEIDKTVSDTIKDLGINKTYIVGGTRAVSRDLETKLPRNERYGGMNRYETANLIANKVDPRAKTVFLASGQDFPDALVIGPVSATKEMPIILTEKDRAPQASLTYFKTAGVRKFYIIGGDRVISNKTVDLFKMAN